VADNLLSLKMYTTAHSVVAVVGSLTFRAENLIAVMANNLAVLASASV